MGAAGDGARWLQETPSLGFSIGNDRQTMEVGHLRRHSSQARGNVLFVTSQAGAENTCLANRKFEN